MPLTAHSVGCTCAPIAIHFYSGIRINAHHAALMKLIEFVLQCVQSIAGVVAFRFLFALEMIQIWRTTSTWSDVIRRYPTTVNVTKSLQLGMQRPKMGIPLSNRFWSIQLGVSIDWMEFIVSLESLTNAHTHSTPNNQIHYSIRDDEAWRQPRSERF